MPLAAPPGENPIATRNDRNGSVKLVTVTWMPLAAVIVTRSPAVVNDMGMMACVVGSTTASAPAEGVTPPTIQTTPVAPLFSTVPSRYRSWSKPIWL